MAAMAAINARITFGRWEKSTVCYRYFAGGCYACCTVFA